jgi:hypothetical protein
METDDVLNVLSQPYCQPCEGTGLMKAPCVHQSRSSTRVATSNGAAYGSGSASYDNDNGNGHGGDWQSTGHQGCGNSTRQ